MPIISMLFGGLLIAVGVWGYANAPADTSGMTALIPAAIGAVLVLLGAVATVERFLKHAMHAAAMVGLLSFLATAYMAVPKLITLLSGGQVDRPRAVQSQAITAALSAVFVGLCVNSFIQVRRRRRAAAQTQ